MTTTDALHQGGRPVEVTPGTVPGADAERAPFNPAAEYGDPDWREPESDAEAAARTTYLDSVPRTPETQAWVERIAKLTREQDVLVDAGVECRHARATHDPDTIAEARRDYETARAATEARERSEDRGSELDPVSADEVTELAPQPEREVAEDDEYEEVEL